MVMLIKVVWQNCLAWEKTGFTDWPITLEFKKEKKLFFEDYFYGFHKTLIFIFYLFFFWPYEIFVHVSNHSIVFKS